MPVTAIDLTFICTNPDGTEGHKTYPAGTPATFCIAKKDEEGAKMAKRVSDLTKSSGEEYRLIMIDNFERYLPMRCVRRSGSEP